MKKLRFIFLLFPFLFQSQVFQRFSDGKTFEDVNLFRNGKELPINASNFKNFVFNNDDKVFYNGKLIDFSVENDILIFFDKVKEIEGVQVRKENLSLKKEKTLSNSRKKHLVDIAPNNTFATLVVLRSKKTTYVKSLTLFPEPNFFSKEIDGKIRIQILPCFDGIPDNNPIISMEEDISKVFKNKWEIILPRIIKYPSEGFFISLYYPSKSSKTITLRLSDDTSVFMYYPQYKEWRKMNFNGLYYKIKILQ